MHQSDDPYTSLIELPPDTKPEPMGFMMTDEEMFGTVWGKPEDPTIPEPDRGIKMYSKVERKERLVDLREYLDKSKNPAIGLQPPAPPRHAIEADDVFRKLPSREERDKEMDDYKPKPKKGKGKKSKKK